MLHSSVTPCGCAGRDSDRLFLVHLFHFSHVFLLSLLLGACLTFLFPSGQPCSAYPGRSETGFFSGCQTDAQHCRMCPPSPHCWAVSDVCRWGAPILSWGFCPPVTASSSAPVPHTQADTASQLLIIHRPPRSSFHHSIPSAFMFLSSHSALFSFQLATATPAASRPRSVTAPQGSASATREWKGRAATSAPGATRASSLTVCPATSASPSGMSSLAS